MNASDGIPSPVKTGKIKQHTKIPTFIIILLFFMIMQYNII